MHLYVYIEIADSLIKSHVDFIAGNCQPSSGCKKKGKNKCISIQEQKQCLAIDILLF